VNMSVFLMIPYAIIEISELFFVFLLIGVFLFAFAIATMVYYILKKNKSTKKDRISHKNYLSLIDNFNGMAYRCLNDNFWTMKFVSKKTFELIGYHEFEIIDNNVVSFEELIHPQYRRHLREKWQMILKQHEDFSDEYIIVTKTGEEKWVHETGHGVFDSSGKVKYIEGFIHDVTSVRAASIAERKNYEKYRSLIENSHDGIIIEEDRIITYINTAGVKLFRAQSEQDLLGKCTFDLVTEKYRDFVKDRAKRLEATHLPNSSEEIEIIRLDGTIAHVEVSSSPYIEKGKLILSVFIHDISATFDAIEQIKNQTSILEMIIYGTSAGTWEFNVQTEEIHVNERWCEMIGYSYEELHPRTLNDWKALVHPDDLVVATEALNAHFIKEKDDYSVEIRMRHRDGHYIWVFDKGKVSKWDEYGNPLMMFGTHQDITEKKEKEIELEYVSNHDYLTGLWNRRAFETHLSSINNSESLPLGIIMADVNGLKEVNDTFGHEMGDQLLMTVSQTLLKNHQQDFVSRIGGDEFVIITNHTTEQEQNRKINALVKELKSNHSYEFNISVSFGLALKTDIDESVYSTLRRAEIQMYEKKNNTKTD